MYCVGLNDVKIRAKERTVTPKTRRPMKFWPPKASRSRVTWPTRRKTRRAITKSSNRSRWLNPSQNLNRRPRHQKVTIGHSVSPNRRVEIMRNANWNTKLLNFFRNTFIWTRYVLVVYFTRTYQGSSPSFRHRENSIERTKQSDYGTPTYACRNQ